MYFTILQLVIANKVIFDLFYLRICVGFNKHLRVGYNTVRQFPGSNRSHHVNIIIDLIE